MANELAFATKFASELDKVLEQTAKTGFMTQNDFGVTFIDARTVKIPSMSLVGLGDYSDGFPKGDVTVTNAAYTVSKDRGRTFSIDAVDIGDTGIERLSGQVLSEFVRTEVVPEMDAYVLSGLAGIAKTASQTIAPATYPIATKPYEALMTLAAKIEDAGYDGEKVCFITYDNLNKLSLSSEITKMIDVGDFKNGEVQYKVKKLGDIILIGVPTKRMKTEYIFNAGATSSVGGFEASSTAKEIQLLMLPKNAVSIVKKHEAIRTFSPSENQEADAYKFDYRLHYDFFVKESMKPTVWAMIEA
ncbi:MAG: hypothetical protein ACI39F_03530 [Acutalibacteraceae bacterium]